MLFAGALGTQLIAAFEPQAGFWPLAALFGLGLLVLLAIGGYVISYFIACGIFEKKEL